MKKLLLMFVMVTAAIASSAQVDQGFRNGIRLNVGVSNVVYEGDKFTFGYGFGWVAEYNLNSNLYFQSGVGLENIAHKEDAINGTLNAFYAQIPIHVGYRFETGSSSNFFVQAGPTIGVGLFGSSIDLGYRGSYNYFDRANRFDLGVGGRVGMEFSEIQVSVGTNYGVLNTFSEVGGHNLTVNLGVAYMF